MLENAFSSGNWIVIVVTTIVILAYMYITNKNNHTAEIIAMVDALKTQLDANTANDSDTIAALLENKKADEALAIRVKVIEDMVTDMYTPVTGKLIPDEE